MQTVLFLSCFASSSVFCLVQLPGVSTFSVIRCAMFSLSGFHTANEPKPDQHLCAFFEKSPVNNNELSNNDASKDGGKEEVEVSLLLSVIHKVFLSIFCICKQPCCFLNLILSGCREPLISSTLGVQPHVTQQSWMTQSPTKLKL